MASNDEQRSATTIFTTAAQSIAARLIANKTTVKFTKAEISTTNLFNQSVTELQVLTSLDNVQQTADINTVTVINDSTVDVNIAIDQTKAPNDYQMNSVGLFAVDGDGKEVLYSVTVLKDPVYIHQDAMGSALGIDLETVVGQASNVEISVNPAGAVTNEILKATLADYVKTDDVKSLIPATVIDGSKPADFKESVTLEKGAVDGAGNAIATTEDVSDGDAATLTSAKEYADAQVGDKADDSAVVHNTPTILPSGTDLNVVTSSGYYYIVGAINKPENADDWTIYQVVDLRSSLSNGVQIAYDTNENFQSMRTWSGKGWTPWKLLADDSKVVHLTDMRQPANQVAGIDEVNAKQDKLDYTPANDADTFHRSPDTGAVTESGNFPGLQVKGVDVATAADLKSLEASAWRPLTLENSQHGVILFKDNGDGTASLTGSATFIIGKGKATFFPIIIPPVGYTFTSLKWTKSNDGNSVYAVSGMTGSSSGTTTVVTAGLSNGNICFGGGIDGSYAVTFSPSELTTLSSGINCNPALVSISKV